MNPATLLVRADGGADLGVGHLVRSLALVQAWIESGGRAVLAAARIPSGLRAAWQAEGVTVVDLAAVPGSPEDLTATLAACEADGADWLVLDGYHFDASWQAAAKGRGLKVACMDDLGQAAPYAADLVVNANPQAHALMYGSLDSSRTLLLGLRFVFLRREILAARRRAPDARSGNHLLVTLGGADPDNATAKVLADLEGVPRRLRVTVPMGAANPHGEALSRQAADSRHEVRVVRDPPDIATILASADLAIAAGGTTAWELAYLGVPMVLLSIAENQRPNCQWLARHAAALDLGWARDASPGQVAEAVDTLLAAAERRAVLAARSRELVDGEGTARVVRHLWGDPVRLRLALPRDSETLLRWANDPEVRAASFSAKPITPEEHATWFARKLADPTVRLYLALDERDLPVGQVRFELQDREAEVHVSLAREARGRGLGSAVLRLGTQRVLRAERLDVVHAHVKPENEGSRRAFEKAGYKLAGTVTTRGHAALHFVAYRA